VQILGCAQALGTCPGDWARAATAQSSSPKTLHPRDPSSEQKYRDVQSQQPPPTLAATPSGSVWSHHSHTCAACDSSGWSGALSPSPACALRALPSARGGARTRWAPRLTCFRAAPGGHGAAQARTPATARTANAVSALRAGCRIHGCSIDVIWPGLRAQWCGAWRRAWRCDGNAG